MQQTVNFQCGNCGNLMAVGVEFLGQQVRCPHCQQVVVAPAAAAPPNVNPPSPPPIDPFQGLAANPNDDIFHTKSEPEDALFGEAEAPRLEIARDIVPSSPAQAFDLPLEPSRSEPTIKEPLLPTVYLMPQQTETAPEPAAPSSHESSTVAWSPPSSGPELPSGILQDPYPATAELPTTPLLRRPREDPARVNLFIPLVFIPLVLYAILATAAVGFLYLRVQSRPPSLWEQIPDVNGDNPGVRTKKTTSLNFDRDQAVQPLPETLLVKLGETLRVGDLEVTPIRIHRQRVKVYDERSNQSEPCQYDSLVLTLKLHNVAENYSFTPLDNYFDRHYNGREPSVPLTVLVAGSSRFFGGPAKWYPLKRDVSKREDRQWLDLPGRKNVDPEGLAPGETTQACVCTDGDDPSVTAHLFGSRTEGRAVRSPYTGKLLWRVQVRRGLVRVNGKERSATAVIGVECTAKDIVN